MSKGWFEEFKEAYNNYPSQDNEGFTPERGSFKCGFKSAWDIQQAEIDKLRPQLGDAHFDLGGKLAIAVEALEYYALDEKSPEEATEALTKIRGEK